MNVRLQDLVSEGLARGVVGDASVAVTGVRHDSRAVEPGDLFVAMFGRVFDGSDYTAEAVARGAAAVASERELSLSVPLLKLADAERGLSALAARIYENATLKMPVVGITGTNGKTTVAYLVEQMLLSLSRKPAVMGTVNVRGPGGERPATHTTPMADEVMRLSRWAYETGASELVMEVSSHGLAMGRVEDVHFAVSAFTNLTQDHLDFHGNLEHYAAAKDRLFLELAPERTVINVDDAHGAELAATVKGTTFRYSASGKPEAELKVLTASHGRTGMEAEVQTPAGVVELRSPLLGHHNLENLLCAMGIGMALGHAPAEAARALARATGAPGRLQRVAHPKDVLVFVDYAHTPDALDNVCAALRHMTEGRLVVVFGCGGDRDRGKRPLMAAATARYAELVVVTSDNPRTEDPKAIIADILPGLSCLGEVPLSRDAVLAWRFGYHVEPDRAAAIELAVAAARPGDTVLIAGKGHEQVQIVGGVRLPFDDVAVAAKAIAESEVL